MKLKDKFEFLIDYFSDAMPDAKPELHFDNPYQLICAVILSAQCTDKRVNMTTPALFERFPDAESMSKADVAEVKEIIKSISYPNSKAEHLVDMARGLMEKHGGEVPRGIDSLMELSGVGRKTANVVASVLYNEPVIAVDTHVFRVAHRLGLSKGTTPYAVEMDLEKYIPENIRSRAHHWLILHGRYVCTARAPHCKECALKSICVDLSTRSSAPRSR